MNVAARLERRLPQALLFSLMVLALTIPQVGVVQTAHALGLDRLLQAFARPSAPIVAAAPSALLPPPARPFVLKARSWAERREALHCLAQAIYFEAAFQPEQGQRAVAQVVLNRVRDRAFPKTVCGVVYDRGHGRGRRACQFSFVCDGSLQRRPPSAGEMAKAETLARQALCGYVEAAVGTATHYHSWRVHPVWRHALIRTARIGDHIFYRWPAGAGVAQG